MSLSELTSPTAVRLAIGECKRLGREEFLKFYGFRLSRDYPLLFEGEEYDSKAIAGVAHGYQFPEFGPLKSDMFSGGISPGGAATRLSRLGFHVEALPARTGDWSLHECEVVADAYFDCLRHKLSGQAFTRNTALDRVAQQIGRTRGSVDYKFQNIDSVLYEAGLPRLNEAVAKNAQVLLRFVVLDPLASRMVTTGVVHEKALAEITSDVFVPVPQIPVTEARDFQDLVGRRAFQTNFAERDAKNRALGKAGEVWVVALEKRRLTEAGRPDLAKKVIWVSDTIGDGLGYDIESVDEQGQPLFIEVKATNQGQDAPFFISQTEYERRSENRPHRAAIAG